MQLADRSRRSFSAGHHRAAYRILHDWSEDKILHLLGRVYERLPKGGGVLIAEKLLDDDKAGLAGR